MKNLFLFLFLFFSFPQNILSEDLFTELLVATPNMSDPRFKETVIFMFYHNNELTAHISFVENRAIFFKGNEIWHTNLQSFGPSSPRYTLLIFYE